MLPSAAAQCGVPSAQSRVITGPQEPGAKRAAG